MKKQEKSFFEMLLIWLFILVFLLFYPWTYITLLFFFIIWNAFGMIGKIMTVLIVISVIITLYIIFQDTWGFGEYYTPRNKVLDYNFWFKIPNVFNSLRKIILIY